MEIIRVFPRRTAATPDDENVRVAVPPGMFDEVDEVHVSVAFEWDKPAAEELAYQWEHVASVKIGGPAYGDPGGEFEPGMYVKPGYVITSRGCPNFCWFCKAWQNEGVIRELAAKDGYNVLDNNLLACSREHQERVFQMLSRQPERPRFTGGLEAARFTEYHAEWLVKLKPEVAMFAYDTPDDWEPLVNAAKIMSKAGLIGTSHVMRCYVLIGWKGDTIEAAEARLNATMKLGYMPFAMLYNLGAGLDNAREWKRFQRTWANAVIVGSKMKGNHGTNR
jgi:hypothetical protein